MPVTDPARFEGEYPGCSNEPPWWPAKDVIYWRGERGECPVSLRGPNTRMLLARREKGTLAYWSTSLGIWTVVVPVHRKPGPGDQHP